MIEAIRRHALLAERYRIAGVVTALDAKHGLSRIPQFPECRNQLEAASLVVITKTDLASAAEIAHVRDRLPDLAPHAKVLTSANGELPASAVLAALQGCAACGALTHDHDHHHGDADDGHDHAAWGTRPLSASIVPA